MGAANRGAAIIPLSTVGTRYRSSVSTAWMPPKPATNLGLNWLATAENQREKPIRNWPHTVDTDIDCGRRFCGPRFQDSYVSKQSAVKQRGRERKEPSEIIQKFRLRNWPISSADFPMTPMEGTDIIVAPLGEGFWGNIRRPLVLPAALFYYWNKLHPSTFLEFPFWGPVPSSQERISTAQCISKLLPLGPKSLHYITLISCYRTPRYQKGSLKGSLKGFWRVFEGFYKGSAEDLF